MADSKITALASIGTGTDPANDPLVIVDVSDVSPGGMSTTGTTKKVTLNNLLACSPTATLASATITGDLTVKTNVLKVDTTNNRVGIGTASPGKRCEINQSANAITTIGSGEILRLIGDDGNTNSRITEVGFGSGPTGATFAPVIVGAVNTSVTGFGTKDFYVATRAGVADVAALERYRIASDGVATWSNVGGFAGTAMTLNSTGLGVGGSPAGGALMTVGATSSVSATANAVLISSNKAALVITCDGATNAAGTLISYSWASGGQGPLIFRNAAIANVMTLDASGNVGVGVTPSYKLDTYTTLGGTVNEKRFANRTSNKILVKRYFSISTDTALFSIECGTAGSSNMAAFEINVFATGTKVGVSSDRQFYGKFYVTRNLAGTFTITSAFSSGSSGAFTVAASGTSLNVNGIFSVISDGSACVEITGYIGGRDTIAEANLTVTMP